MVAVTWRGGDSITLIDTTHYVGFFGNLFGNSVSVGEYQDKTFSTNSSGSVNNGELPNVKYINASNADWGDGSEAITNIENAECTLKLTVSSGSGFNLQAVKLIIWDGGSDDSIAPASIIVKAFEKGNSSWTTMSGSGSPLYLTPYSSSSPIASYDYYIGLSASPSVVGIVNTVAVKIYAEYY